MKKQKKIISDHPFVDDTGSVKLAQAAANGENAARTRVTNIAHPIINYQTKSFCKRFCKENRFHYQCTLFSNWGSMKEEALICEWGNASYAWMLDDLTKNSRLRQFKGTDGAKLGSYFFHIANSLPFYERWKDWRFGRKVHVPTYIRDMDDDAARVFLALLGGDNLPTISQKLGRSEKDIEKLTQKIISALTRRKRLHLLDPLKTVSLTSSDSTEPNTANQADIASWDTAPEDREEHQRLQAAWAQLEAVEQFVLEAMLIEGQDAKDVLRALKRLGIAVTKGVDAAETDQQQLYYFRRKTLIKLENIMNEIPEFKI